MAAELILVQAVITIPSATLAAILASAPALVQLAIAEALPLVALVANSNPQLVNTQVIPQLLELQLSISRQSISFLLVIVQSQKKSEDLFVAWAILLLVLLFLTRKL